MSGSEDGQLRSPGADNFISGEDDEHDTGTLNIKPPQANVSLSRDLSGLRRKDKYSKEKKHSKEKRHRDRLGKDRDRDNRERKSDMERGRLEHHRRDEREGGDLERQYHNQRSGYATERADVGREAIPNNNDRRYQKHYERTNDVSGGRGASSFHNFQQHHHQLQNQQYHHPTQMHVQQRPRSDYFDRGQSYHHGGGGGVSMEYQVSRHQQAHVRHADYAQHDVEIEISRERRQYSYDEQKDAESLEQDLRSRLLSKRHKYARVSDPSEIYEVSVERRVHERDEHSFEEYKRTSVKVERHKIRREKETAKVIEVLDSPELYSNEGRVKRKHKLENKNEDAVTVAKRKTPDDPELLARKAKFLTAEQEKVKRKESSRVELEARREMRRERTTVKDALSPTAVAASVTAGLHIAKRKNSSDELSKRKRSKKTLKNESDLEEIDQETDSEDISDSESGAESEDDSYTKSKTKNKSGQSSGQDEDVLLLPDSPLSIGELSKSPKRKRNKTKQSHKISDEDDNDDDIDDDDDNDNDREQEEDNDVLSSRSHSVRSHSLTGSASHESHSSRSHSQSPNHRSHSDSRSSRSSRSHSERSHSRTASRSRSRSEERNMKSDQNKGIADTEASLKKRPQHDGKEDSPVCDAKGLPLPNYFPGIQGCRSVEEFQCLNRIEEGTYGVVYRARDKRTSEIVALKRLKMEKEKEGFPITSLREINTLLKGQHPNIVTVREIVVGSNMDKIFIVMDYVEHDLKSLMETMKNRKQSFFPGEVKCLTQQLLRAVGHLHDNWILHRDLKTSNLLLSHKGILKVGDFGLAREYGSPLKKYTSLVVTLWYRAPELLLCSPEYSTPIDVWSVGCIFAEFLQMLPLFPGKSEIDQLNRIFKELGTPNEKIWTGYKELPAVKNLLSQNSHFTEYPVSNLRKRFNEKASEIGIDFLQGLLTYDPKKRLSADAALKHAYFKELPLPIDPSMFPTWPAKSELGARKALASSPKPPSGGSQFKQLARDDIVVASSSSSKVVSGIITGNKKTATNTGFVLNAGIDQRQLAMGPGFSLKF